MLVLCIICSDGSLDWKMLQSLARSMPDLHKTLILANVVRSDDNNQEFHVQELAIATEHAPFRHKKVVVEVGSQRKRAKLDDPDETEKANT
jgi:hypothetical protein